MEARALIACWDACAQQIHRYCFRPSAAWLYRVATNVLRNQRRSRRRHEAALARLPRPEPEPDFADALAERVTAEQEMRLILDRLAVLHRSSATCRRLPACASPA